MPVTFILAMHVFEFLFFITLPYVFSFPYFVFQLPDLYFLILHIVYRCRIVSSNQKVHVGGFPIVWYHLLNYNANKCWSMLCSCWFVWISQIRCYHQKEDFKIFKFKGFNYRSVFLQHYNFSTLVQHGDIEINPGHKKRQPKYFSCCHWNVNSHGKISLLTAYNNIYQYDVICVSETFLYS